MKWVAISSFLETTSPFSTNINFSSKCAVYLGRIFSAISTLCIFWSSKVLSVSKYIQSCHLTFSFLNHFFFFYNISYKAVFKLFLQVSWNSANTLDQEFWFFPRVSSLGGIFKYFFKKDLYKVLCSIQFSLSVFICIVFKDFALCILKTSIFWQNRYFNKLFKFLYLAN